MANIARAQLSALKKTAGHCVLHMLVAVVAVAVVAVVAYAVTRDVVTAVT